MNSKWRQMIQPLLPFLIAGMTIAAIIGFLVLFSWLMFWGFFIGGIVWLITRVRRFFYPVKNPAPAKGRIIEYRDIK